MNKEERNRDLRRFVGGGYSPVGATDETVLTQSPDWEGINRGINMFIETGLDYAKQASKGGGKQDYSGQYQVEMNDIAANPEYHDASGMYNSKGQEAIRALNRKYAPYVSGAEIRSTESYVGGGYKESVDNALREVNIKQRSADYEAQNTRFVEMWDSAHPEQTNLTFETRARLGKQMSDETNELNDLTNILVNNGIQSITDPAQKRTAEILINRMPTEEILSLGDTVEDQQKLVDLYTSIALQNGHTQSEARVMAINAAQGIYKHLNKYKKDIQQLSEEELKFMKSNDANEAYHNLSAKDRAFYALTGQFSPSTMMSGLTGGISVSDSFKTEKVGEGKYKRKLITTDKNVISFGLNNGDSLTASATLAGVVPQIKKELSKGNSAPLRQLRMLPALAGIVQSDNQSEEWISSKQELADMLSTELVRNSKTYYKGRNVINDEMDYQNRSTVELAQYLGFSNEETKDIINKALETMGLKQINGVYTEDELAGAMSAFNIMPWATEGMEQQPKSVNVEDYLSDDNRMSMIPEPEDEFIDDEEAQMTKVNVYESPEFIDFRNKIMKAAREGRIEPDQARNEIDIKKKEIEQSIISKALNAVDGLFISKAEAKELSQINKDISDDMAQRILNFTAKHEQFVPHVYEDGVGKKQIGDERSQNGGNATIAFGKNLDTNPLTKEQLNYIMIDGKPLTQEEKDGSLGKLLMKKGKEIPATVLKRITITEDNAKKMLIEEMDKAWKGCKKYVKGFEGLDERAQEVCADIAYNAGPGFFTNKDHSKFVEHLSKKEYKQAAWYLERYAIAKWNSVRTKNNAATLRSIKKK